MMELFLKFHLKIMYINETKISETTWCLEYKRGAFLNNLK